MSPKGRSSHARSIQQERKNKVKVLIQVKDVPVNGWEDVFQNEGKRIDVSKSRG